MTTFVPGFSKLLKSSTRSNIEDSRLRRTLNAIFASKYHEFADTLVVQGTGAYIGGEVQTYVGITAGKAATSTANLHMQGYSTETSAGVYQNIATVEFFNDNVSVALITVGAGNEAGSDDGHMAFYVSNNAVSTNWLNVSAAVGVQFLFSLGVTSTTEQLRLAYDASNYVSHTVSSAGIYTIAPTGFVVNLGGGATATAIRFLEPSGSGTNYSSIKAQAQGANIDYTLPATDAAGFMTSNGSGALSWTLAASGVYTPTLTNTTNIDASTAYECQYIRIGSVVTVSGKVDIDATAGAPTVTTLEMTLPIASNFGATEDLGGVACDVIDTAAILANVANDRAEFSYNSTTTSNRTWYFTFTYAII